jgi:hypothetical protein
MSRIIPAVPDMTADEAEAVTREIIEHQDDLVEILEADHELVLRAYKGRAWLALRYPSWESYVSDRFGGLRLGAPYVEVLRQAGMSLRAIEATTGVPKSTVWNRTAEAQSSSDAKSGSPELLADEPPPATSFGLDGKHHPAMKTKKTTSKRPRRRHRNTADQADVEVEIEVDLPAVAEADDEEVEEEASFEDYLDAFIGVLDELAADKGVAEGVAAARQARAALLQWVQRREQGDE